MGEWGVFLSGRDGGAGGFKGEIGGAVKKIVKLLYCFFWRYGLGYRLLTIVGDDGKGRVRSQRLRTEWTASIRARRLRTVDLFYLFSGQTEKLLFPKSMTSSRLVFWR